MKKTVVENLVSLSLQPFRAGVQQKCHTNEQIFIYF